MIQMPNGGRWEQTGDAKGPGPNAEADCPAQNRLIDIALRLTVFGPKKTYVA